MSLKEKRKRIYNHVILQGEIVFRTDRKISFKNTFKNQTVFYNSLTHNVIAREIKGKLIKA